MIGYGSALGAQLPREDLLTRVHAAKPTLLLLMAPAGFGKSTFAQQVVTGAEHVGLVDCAHAQRTVGLAQNVLAGLADAFPDERERFASLVAVLHDASVSLDERLTILSTVWRQQRGPSTIVFENTEQAVRGEPRDLVSRLLAERPRDRRIVICTREPLRMHLSRFAPPHQILTLRAAELAFTDDEVRRALAGRKLSAELAARVARVSGGWPVAVLLFARFADEGRLDALLDELDALAYEELYEYVVDQVFETMPLALRDALLFCSAVPGAGPSDIEAALGPEAPADLERASRESPFVQRRGDTYEVHPLAANALRGASPHRVQTLVRAAAAAYAQRGDPRNAARLFLAAEDPEAAAATLNRAETVLDLDLARMTIAIPRPIRRRFPLLWSAAAMLRLWQTAVDDTRREGEAIWQDLTVETPVEVRLFVGFTRVLYEQYVGRFDEALVLLDELERAIEQWVVAPGDAEGEQQRAGMVAYLHYFRGLVLGRRGALRDAERELRYPKLRSATPPILSGMHLTAGADIARVRGQRNVERREIDRARSIVERVSLLNYVTRCTGEAVIGAWLAGEDDVVTRLAADLEELVDRDGVFALGFLSAMLRGREREPRDADLRVYVCFGHLIAAANADDPGARRRSLAEAKEVAERFTAPFTIVLTSLALAVTSEEPEAQAQFARARQAAAAIDDAPALVTAVEEAAAGGPGGFLTAFLRRYRARGEPYGAAPPVRVCFVSGRVLHHGAEVKLGHMPEALLFALAEQPRGLSVAAIFERFWGNDDVDAARNALKVTLWRLRKALGEIIVRADDVVRLTGVAVDIWETETLYRSARDTSDTSRYEALLRDAFDLLAGQRPTFFEHWEWFEPIARRINERRAEIAALLARIALERGEAEGAQSLGESIAAYDPLDEVAQEIIIRAHLARGDRAEALRCFRRYRAALRTELDCEPSPALAKLVRE